MKRFIACLLAAVMLLGALGCEVVELMKPAKDPQPLMWKVTDPDGYTLYLFGTIHVGDKRSEDVLSHAAKVLDQCDALAVEFDLVAYQKDGGEMMQMLTQYVLTDGTTIEDYMPAETYQQARALLEDAGLMPDMMKNYNLAMWAQLVESAAILTHCNVDSDHAMDLLLLNYAYEKQIPILEVESAAFQANLLGSFDDETYLEQIEATLQVLDVYDAVIEYEYELWLSGDRDQLWSMIAQQSLVEETGDFNDSLYHQRNASMAKKAMEYIDSGKTVFFAVGAGHMANETGIVQLLIDAGYTVEQIDY